MFLSDWSDTNLHYGWSVFREFQKVLYKITFKDHTHCTNYIDEGGEGGEGREGRGGRGGEGEGRGGQKLLSTLKRCLLAHSWA